MARATSGGQMQDCCTLCKGSGRFLFRAPQLSMEISCPVPMRISLVLCLAGKTGPHVCVKWRTVAHFARGTEAAFPECYDSSRKTAWGPNMLKILASIATSTAAPSPPCLPVPRALSLSLSLSLSKENVVRAATPKSVSNFFSSTVPFSPGRKVWKRAWRWSPGTPKKSIPQHSWYVLCGPDACFERVVLPVQDPAFLPNHAHCPRHRAPSRAASGRGCPCLAAPQGGGHAARRCLR